MQFGRHGRVDLLELCVCGGGSHLAAGCVVVRVVAVVVAAVAVWTSPWARRRRRRGGFLSHQKGIPQHSLQVVVGAADQDRDGAAGSHVGDL